MLHNLQKSSQFHLEDITQRGHLAALVDAVPERVHDAHVDRVRLQEGQQRLGGDSIETILA